MATRPTTVTTLRVRSSVSLPLRTSSSFLPHRPRENDPTGHEYHSTDTHKRALAPWNPAFLWETCKARVGEELDGTLVFHTERRVNYESVLDWC